MGNAVLYEIIVSSHPIHDERKHTKGQKLIGPPPEVFTVLNVILKHCPFEHLRVSVHSLRVRRPDCNDLRTSSNCNDFPVDMKTIYTARARRTLGRIILTLFFFSPIGTGYPGNVTRVYQKPHVQNL